MKWEDPGSTALVVPVPEAEPLVGRYRRAYTPSGAEGMPAHVTLLAPFTPAASLVVGRVREVREVLEQFAAFQFLLTGAERFDNETLYLVPEPADPFIAISTALTTSFPEHPYPPAGRGKIVPHLTVARSKDSDLLDAIEGELSDHLPLEATAREVLLMERQTDRRWTTREAVRLESA